MPPTKKEVLREYILTTSVDEERRAALGQLCICWAHLEQRIEQAIWALRGINRKVGRPITKDWSIQSRLDAMVSEAKKKFSDPADHSDLEAMRIAIRKLAKIRNWSVHGLYGMSVNPANKGMIFAISYKDNPAGQALEITADGLRHITAQTQAMTRKIERFFRLKLGAPLP